jgi:hypothetical protein
VGVQERANYLLLCPQPVVLGIASVKAALQRAVVGGLGDHVLTLAGL